MPIQIIDLTPPPADNDDLYALVEYLVRRQAAIDMKIDGLIRRMEKALSE